MAPAIIRWLHWMELIWRWTRENLWRLLERPVQVNLHCCIFWEAWINLQAEKLQ